MTPLKTFEVMTEPTAARLDAFEAALAELVAADLYSRLGMNREVNARSGLYPAATRSGRRLRARPPRSSFAFFTSCWMR